MSEQYTYGFFLNGLCVDEIVLEYENEEVATKEFLEILGWEQRRGNQNYEVHLMTDIDDEGEIIW